MCARRPDNGLTTSNSPAPKPLSAPLALRGSCASGCALVPAQAGTRHLPPALNLTWVDVQCVVCLLLLVLLPTNDMNSVYYAKHLFVGVSVMWGYNELCLVELLYSIELLQKYYNCLVILLMCLVKIAIFVQLKLSYLSSYVPYLSI